jgi:hypothetical protein
MPPPRRTLLRCLSVLAGLALIAARADTGDLTVFVTKAKPGEVWADGYGAALGSTSFRVVRVEAEVARVPGELADTSMTSFTGAALLAPPLPIFTPYAGLGVGLYRQTYGQASDIGYLKGLIVGAKMTLGLAVVRADYRKLELSGPPPFEMTSRLTLGAGISF